MELTKSHWIADEHRVHLAVPFSKVDKENRLVSGFATLDNIDTSKDVVTAEASKEAFARARGNVREMHQPIAAGRIVDFREDEFFHKGEFFRGIYTTVYVSKGAEDTWQKVLDGTLSGFSIAGNITDQETKFVKDAGEHGETIRFIKGYDLNELSLVDNPCNDLANFDAIVKMLSFEGDAGNKIMKGMVAETVIVNVFWCPTDEIAKNSKNATENCLSCGSQMEQIGWFEQGEDNVVKTAGAVADFLRLKEGLNVNGKGEGGVEKMADEEKTEEEKGEETPAEGVVTSEEVTEGSEEAKEEEEKEETPERVDAEAAAEGAQVPENSDEVAEEFKEKRAEQEKEALEKMFDELRDSVTSAVEDTVKKIDERTSEFEKTLESLREDFEEIKKEREAVSKRLETLEGSSAVKKSGDVEGTEPVKKAKESLWAGTFFDARD